VTWCGIVYTLQLCDKGIVQMLVDVVNVVVVVVVEVGEVPVVLSFDF